MSLKASGRRELALARPVLGRAEEEAARRVLRSGRLVQGPEAEAFEEEFARSAGYARAVAVSSGTAALLVALEALGLAPGDEVVVPALTFVATANAVRLAGGVPVAADVEPDSLDLDPHSAAAAAGPRTNAVVPVHQFGLPADLTALAAALPGIRMVEDAACAAGADTGLPRGVCACFSFHPRKTITTGEGGMVTTDDTALAERVRRLRQHGVGSDGHIHVVGHNLRMSELAAAIGRVQLTRLPDLLARRRQAATWYRQGLAGVDWLRLPQAGDPPHHTFQSYVVRLEPGAPVERDTLVTTLRERGIGCQPCASPVHRLPACPEPPRVALTVSEQAADRGLFLPMHAGLEEDNVAYVCQVVRQAGR